MSAKVSVTTLVPGTAASAAADIADEMAGQARLDPDNQLEVLFLGPRRKQRRHVLDRDAEVHAEEPLGVVPPARHRPRGERAEYVRNAVAVLDKRNVDFEYDGEMAADVALSRDAMALYPFCRLTAPANVLVMPAAHSASISTKMLQQLGGITVVGPLLTGLAKPVQIASMSATTTDIVNLAAIAAFDINR